MKRTATILLILALVLPSVPSYSAPLGTSFAYQGRLKDAGVPANGLFDFEFKLFDDPVGGSQIAATVTKDDVSVAAGVFTVNLDFGGSPFKGAARFLEIAVRPGASAGAYTPFSGRHELTPVPYALAAGSSRTYRWAVFHTYDQSSGWFDNNLTTLFGGVNPSSWTDANAIASQMSSDKGVLGVLFNNSKTIASNGNSLVRASNWYSYSSTNGEMTGVLFRVRNTTATAIDWTPFFRYTSYGGWNEWASLTLNGANNWNSGGANCGATSCTASVLLSIPADRVSTVIVIAGSGPNNGTRSSLLAFLNNSLNLPPGLEFVDDLDTAPNGWNN